MLHVIVGSHYEKAQEALAQIKKTTPEMSVRSFDDGSFDIEAIEELTAGSGMFGDRYVVVIHGGVQNVTHRPLLLGMLQGMRSCDNVFVLMEESMLAPQKKKFESSEIIDVGKPASGEAFNMFALTDTVGNRDKKKGWLLLQQAYESGADAEHVIGILWWAMKNMLLVAKSIENPGLKPFVYNKTKQQARNYSLAELEGFAQKLVQFRYRARTGASLAGLLEQWILAL
jgi:DNA polymerase III delta subunit